ncbi:IPT/TIG domain-containing protein [Lentisalinibacter orientalis]|uniref:IPT/TIG domain-containing protein n=1 Tax=Lentisalinibacter orientalis TaxID=2992241 RepID=UPI00386CFDC8
MSTGNRVSRLAAFCLAVLLAAGLTACGGGGGGGTAAEPAPAPPVAGGGNDGGDAGDGTGDESGDETDDDGGREEEPGDEDDTPADAGFDAGKIAESMTLDTWLQQGLRFVDADGDGIPDEFDPAPATRPRMADPSSDQSLTVEAAWSVIDGRRVDDVALEGHPLQLEVTGLPAYGSNGIWVVFRSGKGYRAARASIAGEGLLEVMPEPDSFGAHVVVGSSRGQNYELRALRLDEPLLFPLDGSASAGGRLTLDGRNLDRVQTVTLGGEPIPITGQGPDALTLTLPEAARGNRLLARTGAGLSNALAVDLRQEVGITIAGDLPLAQGEHLTVRLGGGRQALAYGETLTASLPAWAPTTLSFDVVGQDGAVRSPGILEVIVWPGDRVAEVSERSTLVGRLMGIRRYLDGLGGDDWSAIRGSLERALTTPAARDYLVTMTEHIAGRGAAPEDSTVSAVARSWESLTAETAVTAGTPEKATGDGGRTVTSSEPRTPTNGKQLDSIVASTIDDPDPEGEAVRQTFGNENSQVTVLRHGDADVTVPGLFSIGGCSYGPEEVQWKQAHEIATAADEYRALWRSDLCMQVDGKVVLSAAVFKPGFRDPDAILGEMAQAAYASQNPKEVVRRHSRSSFADLAYQYAAGDNGGYYLRGDDGTPLCHMEECYIEVITSGYGLFNPAKPLSETQKELVRTLRIRMWLEAIIPWILDLAEVGESDTRNKIGRCMIDGLMGDPALRDAIDRLVKRLETDEDKIKADPADELAAAFDATVSDWARKYVKGQLGPQLYNCMTKFLQGEGADAIEKRITDKWPDSKQIFKFVEIYEFVRDLGSAVFTPERFVFKIEPRAQIRKMTPQTIDAFDTDRTLVLEGDWLGNLDPDAPAPCLGEGWCPQLVIRDQFGNSTEVGYIETDISGIGNCGFACTRLEMPFSAIDFSQLGSGPLEVELAIGDTDGNNAYDSYPGNKLRVPVPGDNELLLGLGGLGGVDPPIVQPGEEITVLGFRMDLYGDSAIWDLVSESDTSVVYTLPLTRQVNEEGTKVGLKVLERVPRGLYRVVLRPNFDADKDNLPTLVTRDPIFVDSEPRPLIAIGDQGVEKDDTMRVTLLDKNGDPVYRRDDPLRLPIDNVIPQNRVDAQGNPLPEAYTIIFTWDDSVDESGNTVFLNAPVQQIGVECADGGRDGLCTYGVRSARDRICLTGLSTPTPSQARKIESGTDKLGLARPIAGTETYEGCDVPFGGN